MRFNVFRKQQSETINHEGAMSYKTSPELELYAAVVTASLSNTFYEKHDTRLDRIVELIGKVEPQFVAQLAVYCREQMYLRSVPMVLVAELSKVHNGDSLVSRTTERVIQRADEITELLAYYQLSNLRTGDKQLNKLSKQVQKGVAGAFNKFDEYQFAKYNRQTAVTLKDALFLTHPRAKSDEQQAIFNKIVAGDLKVPYTWEVELSALGQQCFASELEKLMAVAQKWEELIFSGKLGYMALMRNLRNILQAGVSVAAIKKVADVLKDPHGVRKSRQLPFRFLSAYNELKKLHLAHVGYIMDALEEAIKVSAENISGFGLETRVLLAADVSGSMYQPISRNSTIQCYDVGLVLSMLLASRSDNVATGIFGSDWEEMNLSRKQILSNVEGMKRLAGRVGYATNGYKVIRSLIAQRRVMDKVMFFTDLQMYDSGATGNTLSGAWKDYKRNVAPHAKLYLFDLAGYGNTPLQVRRDDVFLLAGWSDKIFDVLTALEEGGDAIKMIKSIEI